MIKVAHMEQVITKIEDRTINVDRYDIEVKSPLATKEYSVFIDFEDNNITGVAYAYGELYDLELNDCLELLKNIKEPLRAFDHIVNE